MIASTTSTCFLLLICPSSHPSSLCFFVCPCGQAEIIQSLKIAAGCIWLCCLCSVFPLDSMPVMRETLCQGIQRQYNKRDWEDWTITPSSNYHLLSRREALSAFSSVYGSGASVQARVQSRKLWLYMCVYSLMEHCSCYLLDMQ